MRRHNPLVVLLNFGKKEVTLHNLHVYLKMQVLYSANQQWPQDKMIGILTWTYHQVSKLIIRFSILLKILPSKEDLQELPLIRTTTCSFIISNHLITRQKSLHKTNNNFVKILTSLHSINLQINQSTYSSNNKNNLNYIIHIHNNT